MEKRPPLKKRIRKSEERYSLDGSRGKSWKRPTEGLVKKPRKPWGEKKAGGGDASQKRKKKKKKKVEKFAKAPIGG